MASGLRGWWRVRVEGPLLCLPQLSTLEALVARAAGEVDARVMDLLYSKFQLSAHWDAVLRYVLLGQGDFVMALLDAAAPELSKPAKEVGGARAQGLGLKHHTPVPVHRLGLLQPEFRV